MTDYIPESSGSLTASLSLENDILEDNHQNFPGGRGGGGVFRVMLPCLGYSVPGALVLCNHLEILLKYRFRISRLGGGGC